MKYLIYTAAAALIATDISAQTIQEIATGAGYQKQSYIQLAAGTEKQVSNTAWDIAFTVFGVQDAGIFVNESAGTSAGQPLPQVELYHALTDDFNEQPDPSLLTDFRLYNNEKSWNYGAFNALRDTVNVFDYGWGDYNPQTNSVAGHAVFVIKLRSGQYRKLKIESLNGTTYTFKYAKLDGSNLVTRTINKTDHAGKTLAYFSLDAGNTVDVEPASGGFDLVYLRYVTLLLEPGTNNYLPYNVTGILSGKGVQVAKADGVDPVKADFAQYKDSLRTALDVIGHDWKSFSGSSWSIDDDRVYFVKTASSRVWKLHFIDFEGSSTGKAVFEKTDLGVISAVQDPAALGLGATLYPNPVQDRLTVALEVPAAQAGPGQLQVIDLLGRLQDSRSVDLREGFQVFELPAGHWAPGACSIVLTGAKQSIHLGKIVKL